MAEDGKKVTVRKMKGRMKKGLNFNKKKKKTHGLKKQGRWKQRWRDYRG